MADLSAGVERCLSDMRLLYGGVPRGAVLEYCCQRHDQQTEKSVFLCLQGQETTKLSRAS